MPSLTDGEIRRALKQVEQTGKQLSLVDGEGHGTGRLVLVMKPMPTRVTADWMAQQWRDQKRLKKKLGSYPSMSLGTAREVFARDFADMIQKGRSIKIAGDTRAGTVADLFEAYVAHLKASGKSSWKEAEKVLNKIADTVGRNRPARDIEPDEITDVIRPIYDRGKRSMADHVRSYIRSAYSWGLKSEHDYRSASQRRFRLVYNPAAGIPTEPKKSGLAGLMKRSSSAFTAGWNAQTRQFTPLTHALCAFSCSRGNALRKLPVSMSTNGTLRSGSSTGQKPRTVSRMPFQSRKSQRI